MIIWLLLNTQYLLTLLTSCFPHLPHVRLPRHHFSPSSFSHSLSCTFCYLICLPRTSDFANTQLVRLPTLGSVIAWAHLPHHDRKWALPLSLHVPSIRNPAALTDHKRATHPRVQGFSLTKGLAYNFPQCAFHIWTSQPSFCLFV